MTAVYQIHPNGGRTLFGIFPDLDEAAMAVATKFGQLFYEEDLENPGCADALTIRGQQFSFEE